MATPTPTIMVTITITPTRTDRGRLNLSFVPLVSLSPSPSSPLAGATPPQESPSQPKPLPVVVPPVVLLLGPTPAFAQAASADGKLGGSGMSARLSVGLAALGCGLAQGRAIAAALEGIARNPQAADKIQTPMLIGLVFIETLVLFTFGFGFLAIS